MPDRLIYDRETTFRQAFRGRQNTCMATSLLLDRAHG